MTTPKINGYNDRRYRNQAADHIQAAEDRLAKLSQYGTLPPEVTVVILEAQVHCVNGLRWLEKDGAMTQPKEIGQWVTA